MKKKVIKKKMTLEDIALTLEDLDKRIGARIQSLDKKIDDLGKKMTVGFDAVHDRIDNFRSHVDQKFNQQTEEFSTQIVDVLEVVDDRFNRLEARMEEHGILDPRTRTRNRGIA